MSATLEQTWIDVCRQSDLTSHVGSCVLLEDIQVAVFYLQDEDKIFAIDNYDPKSGANVLSRGMVGDVNGELVVASPIYKQHYNLETGVCLEDEEVAIRTFPARIESGMVQLTLPR
ncbi:MAG: nitrite reductase small subunit NirD [Planctomycetes bacterium]|nr:nitrite reductase small subunit NirD [Planctomycetota bacterium]